MISYTFPRDHGHICTTVLGKKGYKGKEQARYCHAVWLKGSLHRISEETEETFSSPEPPQKRIIKSVCCMSLLVPHCHGDGLFTTHVMCPYGVACVGKQRLTQLAFKPWIIPYQTESSHFSFNEIWTSAMELMLMGTAQKSLSLLIKPRVFCAVGSWTKKTGKCWAYKVVSKLIIY